MRGPRPVRLAAGLVLTLGASLLAFSPVPSAAAPKPTPVVVELMDGASPSEVAAKYGITADHVYTEALNGFAASVSAAQAASLRSDPGVQMVARDQVVARIPRAGTRLSEQGETEEVDEQLVAQEIMRIKATSNRTADIDGRDDRRVNADIAVLDGGVDPDHPDLNVVGGYDCVGGPPGDRGWHDRDGHGTIVSGLAAAIDNKIGIVGAAPGARIWAIRVADFDGFLTDSDVLCGLDWVNRHAGRIEVVNMSFAGDGNFMGPCLGPGQRLANALGPKRQVDPIHIGLCLAAKRGVSLVAAAGNDAADAATYTPAAYPEVIAVSAMVDFDGLPGGLAPPPAYCFPEDVDDTFAVFSNFGAPIDVAAPGVCVTSTYPGNLYAIGEGTSFAAPLVSGGAALLLARKPWLKPAQVRARIVRDAEPGPIAGDPDEFPEGVLDVSTF